MRRRRRRPRRAGRAGATASPARAPRHLIAATDDSAPARRGPQRPVPALSHRGTRDSARGPALTAAPFGKRWRGAWEVGRSAPNRLARIVRVAQRARGGVMSEFLLDRASDVARRQRCRDSTRASAAQQGTEVSGRSAQGGGDRRRHARRRRSCARPPPTRPDRALVASRAADPRGARPDRGRSRSAPRLAPDPARQGRAPPRGRHGRVGMGRTPALARAAARASGSVPCSASSPARPAAATGRPVRHARSCGARLRRPGFGAASRRTNCATPTPSRWPAKACR